jgi:hypothetical protein
MASPGLDGNAGSKQTKTQVGGTSAAFPGLSTSTANDTIIVFICWDQNSGVPCTVRNVTSTNLTFKRRGGVQSCLSGAGFSTIEEWVAVASGTLSGEVITVSFTNAMDNLSMLVQAFTGAPAAAPYDSNAGLPATAQVATSAVPPTVTFSTSKADDLLLYVSCNSSGATQGGANVPAGWTELGTVNNASGSLFCYMTVAYKSVSATQSGATVACASATAEVSYVGLVDAITTDAGGVAAKGPFFDTNAGAIQTITAQSVTTKALPGLSTDGAGVVAVVNTYDVTAGTPSISSVTSTHLTFTKRSSVVNTTSGAHRTTVEVWEAPSSGALTTEVITVNYSAAVDNTCIAGLGIKDVFSTASPFDSNGAVPATAFNSSSTSPPALTLSTSQANDLLLFAVSTSTGTGTTNTGPLGWSRVTDLADPSGTFFNNGTVFFKNVHGTQSAVTVTPNSAAAADVSYTDMVDAFTADAAIVFQALLGRSALQVKGKLALPLLSLPLKGKTALQCKGKGTFGGPFGNPIAAFNAYLWRR